MVGASQGRSIDEKRVAEPIQTRQKITESKPPPDIGRRDQAIPAAARDAIDEQDEDGEGQKQDGPGVKRRHRQSRDSARSERDRPALPTPGQNDTVDQIV